MAWRVVAIFSLGVNFLLAAFWISAARRVPDRAAGVAATPAQLAGGYSTNTLLRRQNFSWHEVESSDYPTYITNLRYIGCPEQTIRDIIIADVNSLYARRLATELTTPEQQWWRSEPDTNVLMVAEQKARALDDERRGLLTKLLGTNWESGDMISLPRPSRPGIVLDGPILGSLAPDVKQTIEGIYTRSEERMEAYLDAQRAAGRSADPVELARIRQDTRDELARVLAPGQLEEYLLRYSQTANDLRDRLGKLQYFNATPDEFRALFKATDSIDQQLELLAGNNNDPATLQARRNLEAQRENAIRIALGGRRYDEYQLLQDPLYRDAVAAADQAGTPEAARTIYQINLAAASTQNAITNSGDLDADQKAIELKQLELDQMRANALATGRQLPPEPPPPQPVRRTYTLRPGDTPSVVGMIYGVPESAIRAANPNTDFSRLRPGDSIYIPRTAMVPAPGPVTSPIAR